MKRVTIGIIGANGQMGRWFNRFFTGAGHRVLLSDLKTELRPKDIAQQSDVVTLSVPLDVALILAREIGPVLRKEQLFMDFCSMKKDIVEAMARFSKAEVVGTHPLFGPYPVTIKGQNMIMCPQRGDYWQNWLENELRKEGAIVTHMTAEMHDRNMAVVQGLTHMLTVCLGRLLQKLNMNPKEAMLYSTPVFRIHLDLIGRILSQDPNLYDDLIGGNRHVSEMLEEFSSVLNEGKQRLLSGNKGEGASFMEEISQFFDHFCQHGLDESNKIIDAIYLKK
ncbi:MAG: prephenate dehydrogenase/arogenate dehydrogenase family protein [Thermodesulfobacteriota bacterium]|nr:prephenate dehydrogenase/arogenate dehydrogenase family protein [Thermodesulfobacteriota bacterium]